jgi:hypothetical protein
MENKKYKFITKSYENPYYDGLNEIEVEVDDQGKVTEVFTLTGIINYGTIVDWSGYDEYDEDNFQYRITKTTKDNVEVTSRNSTVTIKKKGNQIFEYFNINNENFRMIGYSKEGTKPVSFVYDCGEGNHIYFCENALYTEHNDEYTDYMKIISQGFTVIVNPSHFKKIKEKYNNYIEYLQYSISRKFDFSYEEEDKAYEFFKPYFDMVEQNFNER